MEKFNFNVPSPEKIIDIETGDSFYNLHDPQFWDDLDDLKENDPEAYYEKINKIVEQRENENNQKVERLNIINNEDKIEYEKPGEDLYIKYNLIAEELKKKKEEDRKNRGSRPTWEDLR